MPYKPNLKKWKKRDAERVAKQILDYTIRKDCSIVNLSTIRHFQRTRIMLSLSLDKDDPDICYAELGYDYPTPKLREFMYEKVVDLVRKMFEEYDEKLKKEGKEPKSLKIIRVE